MRQFWKAGWRCLALCTGALLVLLAGYTASAQKPRIAAAKAHPRLVAHHHKTLPIPQANAPLDQADPAAGYASDLWSGGPHCQHSLVLSRLSQVTHPISYQVRTVFDAKVPLGERQIARQGNSGEAVETVRRVYEGTRMVSVAIVSDRVVRQPQDEIVALGAKLPEASRGEPLGRVAATLPTVDATAYWANPQWSNGRTATGVAATYGVVAVDPSVIPLGTRLYIPGYGYGTAADTGGAIVGDRVDLCFDTAAQALDWGRQTVTVYELAGN